MAGRARFHALQAELERRTRDLFEDEPERTHLDYVCERVENATTTKAIALELSTSLGDECTYARLMGYLRNCFGEEAAERRIESARTRASHLLPEEGLELVDNAGLTPAEVSKASAQARQRNWMAEKYNAPRFGSSKGTNVSISITSLHLDALRAGAFVPKTVTGSVESITHNAAIDGAEQVQAHAIASLRQHSS